MQSKAIKKWQPWRASTGAKSDAGKAVSSQNAFKGGHRPLMRDLAKALCEQELIIRDYENSDE